MRMVSLLEYVKLLLHEVNEHLMLLDVRLFDDFQGTDGPCLLVCALVDLAEGAFTEHSTQLVLVGNIIRLLEALEEAKLEHFPQAGHCQRRA